jgi:hypothetical protein
VPSSEGGHPHTAPREHAVARIIAHYFISLDGVVESPDQWHFP